MSKKIDNTISEIKREEKLILLDTYSTAREKVKFIESIKNGLGDEIKNRPNSVKIIKKPIIERIGSFLKKY